MSDLDRPMQSSSEMYEHLCTHPGCRKWGGFGFAKSAGVETRWWCWEHYPHKRPSSAQAEAAEIADLLGTKATIKTF